MKILITGANGQVGRHLLQQLRHHKQLYAYTRSMLDICQHEQVEQTITTLRPDIIINAAAHTHVEQAEHQPELAYQTNHHAVQHLAHIAQRTHATLIHLSTDYIFDGKQHRPYHENDPPHPLNHYGKSKLAGEQAIQNTCHQAIILRTSWVFSEYNRNFVRTLIQSPPPHLNMVTDQYGSPTYAGDIAAAISQIIAQLPHHTHPYGIYHFSGSPHINRYDFAKKILHHAHQQGLLSTLPQLHAITSQDTPSTVQRPHYSCLNNDKIQRVFQITPSDWQKALQNLTHYVHANY